MGPENYERSDVGWLLRAVLPQVIRTNRPHVGWSMINRARSASAPSRDVKLARKRAVARALEDEVVLMDVRA
jgi:hypothetical protein